MPAEHPWKTATTGGNSSHDVLNPQGLNRALLARQLLLRRSAMPIVDTLEHLVGLQAQNPMDPYYALWSRLVDFNPDDLGRRITDRNAVRIILMRGTIHLVTADDCLTIRPVVQAILTRVLSSGSANGRDMAGVDINALVAAAEVLLTIKPRTLAHLRTALSERWPDHDPAALARNVQYLLPLVQVPPRGVWGKSAAPVCTTAQTWLGRPLATNSLSDDLIVRYLTAFGPATTADIRTWSGLAGVRAVVERLRPRLRTFRDDRGRELFDVSDAPLPDSQTVAPPRFLPEFDNLLLSHHDRRRIITDEVRKRFPSIPNGRGPGIVLINGFVGATWRLTRTPGNVLMRIMSFDPLPRSMQEALSDEAGRFLTFAAPDCIHDLQFIPID